MDSETATIRLSQGQGDIPPTGATFGGTPNRNSEPPVNKAAERIPLSWGGPLLETDYSMLALSSITREMADAAMLRRVDDYEGREVVGQKGQRDCAGMLIPYFWPGEPRAFNYRLRRDKPDWAAGKDGKPRQDRKYLAPPNGANRLYIPPGVTAEQLQDITIPIVIVEGEKKALALWGLAAYKVEKLRFIPIAIAGVWSWRGRVGKGNGPDGERIDLRGPIPDLERIAWKGRTAIVLYDTNVHTNDNVKKARKGIARELAKRQGNVAFVDLPKDCRVNGIDDLLAAWGPDRVLGLFETATPGARLDVLLPPQFEARPNGMFRITTRGEQLSQSQLTNFRATILTNVRLDDGVETKLEFEIEAELMSRTCRFSIPASDFARMDWPIEQMGSAAITFPNQRDYARTAIQALSLTADQRCIYTHTGWCNVEGSWLFLHAGGAIGANGSVPGINVRLAGALGHYSLPSPTDRDMVGRAVRASLQLLGLGSSCFSFPMLAATYRAVLGEADFSLHLVGETGTFKSDLAALYQQHFGAAMDRLHLPGSWSSTGNALEVMAFHAKDTLLTIDDFAPQGNCSDVLRYHAAADRVFRAAGNHAGRGRLESTAKLRETKPPRALILSTGEDVPRGQSVRARLLILELAKGDIRSNELTNCQKQAREGLYAQAMGGFVQWLASDYERRRSALGRRVAELRDEAALTVTHARTPEIVANLQAGFELFLEFAQFCGVLEACQREELSHRCWESLLDAALKQAKHQAATEPAGRFLDLIRSLLTSGRAHLQARCGGAPDRQPASCGWRCDTFGKWAPLGDCIGWVEYNDVYLDPTAAYRVVQAACRDGESLPISEQTLRKRLREKNLLASTDSKRETLTVRRTIGGTSKDVLHLHREILLPEEPADGEIEAA